MQRFARAKTGTYIDSPFHRYESGKECFVANSVKTEVVCEPSIAA